MQKAVLQATDADSRSGTAWRVMSTFAAGVIVIATGLTLVLFAGKIQAFGLRYSHLWPPDQSPWFEGFQKALIASPVYVWSCRLVGLVLILIGIAVARM